VIAITEWAIAGLIAERRTRALRPTDVFSTRQEMTMLFRASILALAMIAMLATTALVSTAASAKPVNIDWGDGRSVGRIHGGWDVGQKRPHGNHGLFCRKNCG
jgi:hypothetical protein